MQTLATPQAVTAVLQLSASLLLAASDASICVFDVAGAGRPLTRLSMHAKQVTSLTQYVCPSQGKSRVLSASLDGAVRVIDPTSLAVVHNFKFPDPVLAAAVSVGSRTLSHVARQRAGRRHLHRHPLHARPQRGGR